MKTRDASEIHVNTPEDVQRLIAENRAGDQRARQPLPPLPPPDPAEIKRDWVRLQLLSLALTLAYAGIYAILFCQMTNDPNIRQAGIAGLIIIPATFIGLTAGFFLLWAVHMTALHTLHRLKVPLHLNALISVPSVPAAAFLIMLLLSRK